LIQAFAAKARALNATARARDGIGGGQPASSTARHRATAMVDAGRRLSREIQELSPATDALSRVEIGMRMVAANTESSRRSDAGVSSRSRGSLEAERVALAGTGFVASARMASSIRGVVPRNLSQREFAGPSGNARGPSSSSAGAGIVINSSPTVVINAPAAGGNVQRDVIGALRAHREELFDQLKRESARRERAQF